MTGLDIINKLQKEEEREKMKQDKKERHLHIVKKEEKKVEIPAVIEPLPKSEVMVPDSTKRIVLRDVPALHLAPFLNRQMLLGHHLGLKGNVKKLFERGR